MKGKDLLSEGIMKEAKEIKGLGISYPTNQNVDVSPSFDEKIKVFVNLSQHPAGGITEFKLSKEMYEM